MMYGSYDAGLMISHKSPFVGISESIYIDVQSLPYGQVPVMYLSDLSSKLVTQCIQLLCNKLSVDSQCKNSMSKIRSSVSFINNSHICQEATCILINVSKNSQFKIRIKTHFALEYICHLKHMMVSRSVMVSDEPDELSIAVNECRSNIAYILRL